MTLVPIGAYARLLRRAAPYIAVGAVLGALGGVATVALSERTYQATTSVLVAAAPVLVTDTPGDRTRLLTVDTEAQRIRSGPVDAALRAAGGKDLLDPAITLSALPNTTTLRITTHARVARSAVRAADATAEAYLQARGRYLEARREARLTTIGQEIADLNTELDRLGPEHDQASFVARTAVLQRRARSQELQFAAESTAIYPGSVIHRASAVRTGRRNVVLPPASGLVLGSAAGLLIALSRRPRIRNADDLTGLLAPGVLTGSLSARSGRRHDEAFALALREACGTGDRRLVLLGAGTSPGPAAGLLTAVLERLGPGVRLQVPAGNEDLLMAPPGSFTEIVDTTGMTASERSLACLTGDGVVLVVAPDSPVGPVRTVVDEVGRAGGRLLGAVLSDGSGARLEPIGRAGR